MNKHLHIDVETFSSVDITTCGSYKYFESLDFEILIICYAYDDEPIKTIDLAQGDKMPDDFIQALSNPEVEKHAHNANFERNAFKAYGIDTPIEQWYCSAVKSAYCGLPLSLDAVSKALGLGDLGKSAEGKALIKLFSCPVKPTKANGMKGRIHPTAQPEKWERYKHYCMQDVVAEREILKRLEKYKYPESERINYILDQKINDRGILVDLSMARNAYTIDEKFSKDLFEQMQAITGLDNPNSPTQLKQWLLTTTGLDINNVSKGKVLELIDLLEKGFSPTDKIAEMSKKLKDWQDIKEGLTDTKERMLESAGYALHNGKWYLSEDIDYGMDVGAHHTVEDIIEIEKVKITSKLKGLLNIDHSEALQILELRQKASKTSTKKYLAMLNCTCEDGRAHGLFQFYGANRTGRWAGRLIQMQNLPQNHLEDLDGAREDIASGDYDLCTLLYDDIPSVLSQLIRTTFVAKPGHTFAVADFSAIEARVISWLSGEAWRLKVFNSHGKIYEASASKMFNIPIELVTKGSDYRAKGKVAELALGYQGAVGALKTMGGEKMGLSEIEMDIIVKKWRKANPAIVQLWYDLEGCAIRAIETRKPVRSQHKGILFECNGEVMTIKLPSGRRLFYQSPSLTTNKWGKKSIRYKGMDQTTKQWTWVDSYGGKFTENIVQAIARDLLAEAMQRLDKEGFEIVMHVHDEVVCEISGFFADETLDIICELMGNTSEVYSGVPFPAEGYLTRYYKKD